MVNTVFQSNFMIANYLPVQRRLVLLRNYKYHHRIHKIPQSALTLLLTVFTKYRSRPSHCYSPYSQIPQSALTLLLTKAVYIVHSAPVLLGSFPIPSPELSSLRFKYAVCSVSMAFSGYAFVSVSNVHQQKYKRINKRRKM